MSPSIRDLFGDPELDEPGGDAPFDPSNLNATLDAVLQGRPIAGAPPGYVPEGGPLAPLPDDLAAPPVSSAPPEGAPAPVGGPPPAPPAPAAPPAAAPPAAPASPFADLSDTELLEMYEVRRALQDPERSVRIKQAYLGIDTPVTPIDAAPAPPPPPAPEPLPADIDPGSWEAQLWTQNQEMRAEVRELKAGLGLQAEQTQQNRELTAATNATQAFAAKYGDRLSIDEIKAVASLAGAQRLPAAFQSAGDTIEQSMERSLEYVLRSNDALLGKVLGAPPIPAHVLPGNQPESIERKRTLHALSSAASPAGESPTRTPITHREDGRLDEKSRMTVVQELVNRMRGSDEGMF